MAEIPVERKPSGVPLWAWILGGALLAALILFFLLRRHDEPAAAVAGPADAGTATATAMARTCTTDDACAASEICNNSSCVAIAGNTGACSVAATHFATGSDQPADADKASFDRMARCLKADPSLKLTVAGDADQRGPEATNDNLADKRARAVAHQLSSRGVSNAQMQVVSYGDHHLLCGENDEACWAKNRRVDTSLNK